MKEVRTTCCYCGVGCGVIATTDGEQVLSVRGDPDHPANRGRLCSKGSALAQTAAPSIQRQVRALVPELRRDRSHARAPATWDAAMSHVTERFAAIIREHGPDSVAFYISGQLLTEDYYIFNKVSKGLIGTNNIDTNSRLCMSSAVAGYKRTLGADAPPACYDDIEQAGVIFIAGSNTAYAHPIVYRRIEAARAANPKLRVIVVDPRRTDTAREADLHLAILPGTDVALFNGMLHVLLWDGLIDEAYIAAHTEGFAELKQRVREYTPRLVAETCGIGEADIVKAAHWFAQSGPALSLYCQGLNQSAHGTDKNAALINLHLATGQIGKPGAGPFSLTGQPNAMGGREVGGMANLLSAHRDLANAEHRAEVAALWGVDDVPAAPGKTAVELFEALADGSIKAVWIACTNPAQSMPDQKLVRTALERAQLVVLQEAYASTATVDYADVLLPATTWAEKEGTVTNSERRITRVNAVLPKPGEARHDWEIVVDFGQRLAALLGKPAAPFDYVTPEAIWNEHRESTRGRDLDITGLSYAMLAERGPQQWPFPQGAGEGKARLYEDGVFATANGKARFSAPAYSAVAEQVDARYPLHLNTGRLRDQWHGMSRSGTVAASFAHAPEPSVQMARADMERRLLRDGDLVHVTSRRGTQILPARASEEMHSGQTFIAMHWGSEYVGGRGVNVLTTPAFDPASKQPELKHAAVKVLKATLPWRFVAFAWADDALALHAKLRIVMQKFAYSSGTLFGRERSGVLLRCAGDYAADADTLRQLDALFGLDTPDVLRYDDARRGNSRRLRVEDGKLVAVALGGDTSAEAWLRDALEQGVAVTTIGRQLLSPSAAPAQPLKARGRIVCNCLNVAESEIRDALGAMGGVADKLSALQGRLRCGTSCGSCVPELKSLIVIGSPPAQG